ncbi:hypothetical protein ACFLZZ_03505 [Nanoarchaeota archaeon]
MKPINFSYKATALLSDRELKNTSKRLIPEIKTAYYDFLRLPSDKVTLKEVKAVIKAKSKLNPSYLIVIGIGGSNLGTIAVQEAVLGKLYNQLNPKIKVLYADTVDSDTVDSIKKIVKGKKVLLNIVSKSGTTTETSENFKALLSLVKNPKQVIATTDRGSELWKLAKQKGYTPLEIPKYVGGRYSVFSLVGLFPLGMLGINLDKLLKGAEDMNKKCFSENLTANPAALGASILYLNHKKGKNIHDTFLFSNDLESAGKWYRQLLAESIGKKKDTGITPTVSIGSTDLHSIAQLYLAGPKDKFTTFVSLEKTNHPMNKLDKIMKAILKGTKIAFKKRDLPFSELTLPDKTEYALGQFLQLKMVETVYLSRLLKVNPFNQPDVEAYKKETKRILSK